MAWMKGKKFSPETIAKWSADRTGNKHHMYGKFHSEETKAKISVAKKGNKLPPEAIAKMRVAMTGRVLSSSHRENIRASKIGEKNPMYGRTGEKHPNWNGGYSANHYPTTWNIRLREAIRERDRRTCCVCGMTENGARHDVHHVDYDKKNLASGNLVTVCHPCHSKTNSNREEWKKFFKKIGVGF